ncbi:replication initiation protein [Pantoea agglomerans]|uniref:replication initiation protein n=1 Tax=Enterobacter agglomerans TaxID=549 RepID=UPI00177BCC65|nr:replication initiation protein [Pantoea agglomerans]MBD8156432.1 replication initiation protein [Pantoea agglomerans]MBD8161202.1 replication initiation protein [Pantoea agglomerans]MBD8234836.1 replication initiation protein [Pantoea agglomerans]MBD8245255.1 replication initiation protein [Pantoea agglomerans]WVL83504.1 replication initiation protein [Pantoea agglomerans]
MSAQPLAWSRSPSARRLLNEAPYLPRCSDNKTAAIVRPVEYAIRYPYMQVNRSGMVSWLIFDLDHHNANIWDDRGLPAPNLIVRSRQNGHSHLYYAIIPVCTSDNARSRPVQYMKAIYRAMAIKLNADVSYSGPVAKTPYHPWWNTTEIHDNELELGELADYVELPQRSWSTGPDLDSVAHSRHCTLFEELRFYAYSIVGEMRETSSYLRFVSEVEAYAHNHNNFQRRGFSSNLSLSQVRATVKSVSRWTWDFYTGNSRCHRGAMQLDHNLPLNVRQRLSAERTHANRRQSTASKIRAAISRLELAGKKITDTAISLFASISRQTVARYRKERPDLMNTSSAAVTTLNSDLNTALKNVNYGVHQITAPDDGLVSQTAVSVIYRFTGESEELGGEENVDQDDSS